MINGYPNLVRGGLRQSGQRGAVAVALSIPWASRLGPTAIEAAAFKLGKRAIPYVGTFLLAYDLYKAGERFGLWDGISHLFQKETKRPIPGTYTQTGSQRYFWGWYATTSNAHYGEDSFFHSRRSKSSPAPAPVSIAVPQPQPMWGWDNTEIRSNSSYFNDWYWIDGHPLPDASAVWEGDLPFELATEMVSVPDYHFNARPVPPWLALPGTAVLPPAAQPWHRVDPSGWGIFQPYPWADPLTGRGNSPSKPRNAPPTIVMHRDWSTVVTRSAAMAHTAEPPKANERERKVRKKPNMPVWVQRSLWAALETTEFLDFIDITVYAINKNYTGGKRPTNPNEKIDYIYDNWDHIDWNLWVQGLIINHFQDRLVGGIGGAAGASINDAFSQYLPGRYQGVNVHGVNDYEDPW